MKNCNIYKYATFAAIAAGLVVASLGWRVPLTAADPIRVSLATNAAVDGETIHLGEVALVEGRDVDQVAALRAVEVGRAPLPGQSLLVHRGQIEMRLRQHDWDPGALTMIDSGPVRVLRNHASVTGAQIAAVVHQFIERHAPWDAQQMVIRPIQYIQDHRVPPGRIDFQITLPKHAEWLGAVPFRVQIMVDGQVVQRVSVPAYIEVWQEVVLAAKPLGRNQPITPDDIRLESMNIARVPANAIFQAELAIGRRASRPIAINSILRADQVELPPVIRRGDVVQVLVENESLRIATQAVAQENGGLGETIRVMNMRSRKNIHARVVDPQTVQVDF